MAEFFNDAGEHRPQNDNAYRFLLERQPQNADAYVFASIVVKLGPKIEKGSTTAPGQ